MTKPEMNRRLASISQSFRLSIYRELRAGCSAYAAGGWDKRNLKAANAVAEWIDRYGMIIPTDEACGITNPVI